MAYADCSCDEVEATKTDSSEALKYKLGSMASVLVAGALGVSLPLLSKKIPTLKPENDIFFMVKAFAAGVILATGFIHVLPDAFESLTSPCLAENPWGKFPFSGFVAMLSAMGTLMADSFATGYYTRQYYNKSKLVSADEELGDERVGHIHVHTHATHGHAHGSANSSLEEYAPHELIRHRIISQVRIRTVDQFNSYRLIVSFVSKFCAVVLFFFFCQFFYPLNLHTCHMCKYYNL